MLIQLDCQTGGKGKRRKYIAKSSNSALYAYAFYMHIIDQNDEYAKERDGNLLRHF